MLFQLEFFAIWALEEVELAEIKQKVLFNIWYSNWDRDLEEPVMKAVLELQQFANKSLYFLE